MMRTIEDLKNKFGEDAVPSAVWQSEAVKSRLTPDQRRAVKFLLPLFPAIVTLGIVAQESGVNTYDNVTNGVHRVVDATVTGPVDKIVDGLIADPFENQQPGRITDQVIQEAPVQQQGATPVEGKE